MSRVAILVASRNRKDLVDRFGDWAARNVKTPHDLYVVECGSERDQWSRHSTLAYDDPEFLGKCFGHNQLLRQALARGKYDAHWVVMNDVVFTEGVDPLAPLLDAFDREPRLALVSPSEIGGHYPQADSRPGGALRPVTTVDYLGFLLRDAALQEVGFLNPAFRYCWGAIHELSFQLHRKEWWLAYSDAVSYRHLGGSTYGAAATKTIPRAEYQRRARRFAYPYFLKAYGADWDRRFFAAAQPFGAAFDTYAHHRAYWATAFTPQELATLHQEAAASEGGASLATNAAVSAATEAVIATATTRPAPAPAAFSAASPRTAARRPGLRGNPCALVHHERLLAQVTLHDPLARAIEPVAAPAPTTLATPLTVPTTPARRAPRAKMSAPFTRADLAPVPADWQVGPPDFVGVGCGKAGGSWWYDLLLGHPQVVPNRLDSKELHYFCHHDFRGPDAAAIALYREAFARPAGKRCGEWSGNFLNHPLAVEWLAAAAPQAKLIALLRNPVDRAVSNWNQFRAVRRKNVSLTGEAAALFDDYSLFPEALWSCLIAHPLRQLLARYPREQLLVLQYEAVKADPRAAFRRTCEFLGVDPERGPTDFARPVNQREYVVPRPDAAARARLADYFAGDVRLLKELLPELDLDLWPDFAASAATAAPTLAPPEPATRRRSDAADVARVLASGKPRRLLLGCGQRPDPRSINVDVDPNARADLFLDAADLAPLPDGSMEEVRSYHLFEHFTREQARRALREWRRVLAPGGELRIECPDLAVCAQELGRHFDPAGEDLALTGLFGPPERAADPAQRHNWGYTRESLARELVAAGFSAPTFHPVDQGWRLGTAFGRDLQVRARR